MTFFPTWLCNFTFQCKDQTAKQKYMQISEAYKKINSVMEGSDGESREVAAFMRMFMDMVGISDSDSIPAGNYLNHFYGWHSSTDWFSAMTFGMMFGARPTAADEWSTDDDEDADIDGDYDDDEDDEDYLIEDGMGDDYLPGEAEGIRSSLDNSQAANGHSSTTYSSSYRISNMSSVSSQSTQPVNSPQSAASNNSAQKKSAEVWEPQVKQYSNMNLKDQVRRERQAAPVEAAPSKDEEDAPIDPEKEKKLKQAKKRAEKRKKQKEKSKQKERGEANKAQGNGNPEIGNASTMNLDTPEFRRFNIKFR